MSCWEMLVEKWIYKCANLWCILDVFFKTWNGENVQRCWRDVDVEGGVAHRDSLCQWDVKPGGGVMGWERCTRSWWRHCSGNLVFVLGGSGYCHLSSLSTWQQRDKKCGRACWMQSLGSVAQGVFRAGVSFTCEWEEEEGGGWLDLVCVW